ncbi:MAG: segregation/condensation protein A [Pseudomonadota bacterium]
MTQEFKVNIDIFEGPMDLLLYLINKNEIDIFDIPIAKITEEFILYLDKMKEMNIEIASEFILMAATLMYIKSKMLLPIEGEDEAGEELDPRADLVAQLLEYKKFKNAAQAFEQFNRLDREIFKRPEDVILPDEVTVVSDQVDISLFDLVDAFQKVVNRVKLKDGITLDPERFTIQEGIDKILNKLEEKNRIYFEDVFENVFDKIDLIVLFLALLEIIKAGLVKVFQVSVNEPIIIEKS